MAEKMTFTGELNCPHCGNVAPMKQLSLTVVKSETIQTRGGYVDELEKRLYWQIVECPACHRHLLREGAYMERFDEETGPEYTTIYPTPTEKEYHLPDKLQKAYLAARKVKNVDANAFAVLLGRLLDMICIDKKARGKTLSDKINSMAEMGIIPEQISRIALGLKDFRNIGAHAELGELSESEIPIVEGLIGTILEYVYEAPAMIDQVRKEIEKLKER